MTKYNFEFDYGKIIVDGKEASQAEIMDILVEQQTALGLNTEKDVEPCPCCGLKWNA